MGVPDQGSVPVGLGGDDEGVPEQGSVPVGLGGDDAHPVGWPLGSTRGLLVAGPPAAGVTTALRTLAVGAVARGIPVLWVAGAAGDAHEVLPAGVDRVIGAEPLRRRLAAHLGSLLLVCDRVGDLDDPNLLEILTRFSTVAGRSQTLAIGTRLDHALRCLRGPIPAVASHRNGLLLSAAGPEGRLLGAALPRRTSVQPPGRGHLFRAGTPLPVQVAQCE